MNKYVLVDSKGWFEPIYLGTLSENKKFYIINKKEDLNYEKLNDLSPKYVFFLHWNWKVDSKIHENFKCILFHTAPLPFGRGGSPIQNLILLGFKSSPVCAIKMIEEIDAGPIYLKEEVSLEGNLDEIFKRISKVISKMINKICSCKELNPTFQEDKNSVNFKRLTKDDNRLDFSSSLEHLYNQIRMVDGFDYPRAYIEKEK